MKKQNGFSIPELLILIVVLGAVFIGTTIKLSYAFETNTIELYEVEIDSILARAEVYGNNNLDLFEETDNITLTVKELNKAGYLLIDTDADYTDPRDMSKNLNDTKILITKSEDSISAKITK